MNSKFGRKNKNRRQMLKNLAISVLIYEKVTTTEAKAKNVRPLIEYAIKTSKINNLTNRRALLAYFLHNENVVEKLLKDLGPRFKDTTSGYTRLFKNKPRVGDGANTVTIILSKSKFINIEEPKKEISAPKKIVNATKEK